MIYTLLPWIVRLEQAISDELLPPEFEAKFNVAGLLRGDSKTRWEAYSKGRQWGILSAEDCRELEDLPPRGIPDDYLVPGNMTALPAPRRQLDGDARTKLAATLGQLLAPPAAASGNGTMAEARCPACRKLLGRNVNASAELWCRRCKRPMVPAP